MLDVLHDETIGSEDAIIVLLQELLETVGKQTAGLPNDDPGSYEYCSAQNVVSAYRGDFHEVLDRVIAVMPECLIGPEAPYPLAKLLETETAFVRIDHLFAPDDEDRPQSGQLLHSLAYIIANPADNTKPLGIVFFKHEKKEPKTIGKPACALWFTPEGKIIFVVKKKVVDVVQNEGVSPYTIVDYDTFMTSLDGEDISFGKSKQVKNIVKWMQRIRKLRNSVQLTVKQSE